MKPLVKWSGGKTDEIATFSEYIPEYKTYIEPFVGGGSLFFRLSPTTAVINDVHTELIAFYREIGKNHGQQIYDFMEENANNEQTYYRIRDEMKMNTDLDVASRFYYLRKTCYRGMMRYNSSGKFNIPFGRYKTMNYSDLIKPDYQELLSRTTIENKPFEDIFAEYNDESNFMFIDPPYDNKFTDYGYCKFGRDEQQKLANCFKTTKNKCLMIIGKTEFISKLYDGYIRAEYEKKYRFKIHSKRVGAEINNKHLIITNY